LKYDCPELDILCADPPWPLGDKLPGGGRGAAKHYTTLSIFDLQRFPIPPMKTDSLLFMWRVSAMQEEALRVMRAWKHVPKSEIVWVKMQANTSGNLHMGMGRYVRLAHELCIIGARGAGRELIKDHAIRSVLFDGGNAGGLSFDAAVGEHSEKPQAFYDLVDQLCPEGERGDLFARKRRERWHAFGDEVDGRKEDGKNETA
jgi:N6-adenosine-specific RNA methylase IME4